MTDVMETFLDKNLEPEVKVYRIARDLMKMGSFHGNEPLWYGYSGDETRQK